MADSGNYRNPLPNRATACALLTLGVGLHYGWALVPAEHQAQAWNIAGAIARLALLTVVLWHMRGPILAVGLWFACEELMVIGCSGAYIISPWEILPGQAQCSALLNYDLGTIGVVAIALLAIHTVRVDRSQKDDKP